MDLTAWVDVAIGLTLIYLGVSLFVTVINEYIAQALSLRGKQLRDSLKKLISDPKVQGILSSSPALKPFFEQGAKKPPSYVDPNVFARLLVGGLTTTSSAATAMDQVADSIKNLTDSALKTQLQAIVSTAENKMESLVAAVSDWTDRSLTMLGEGYKRRLQRITFWIGIAVAIGLNIDTVVLTEHLYRDKEARAAAVALAVDLTKKTDREAFDKCMAMPSQQREKETACSQLAGLIDLVKGRNESLGKLPVGWSDSPVLPQPPLAWMTPGIWLWIRRGIGWFFTALAVSLGAPFWFDLLSKLVNIRHGMRKPEVEEQSAK